MKLQINTDTKTITIETSVNLGELYEALFRMFPKFTWKEYSIIAVKTIEHWTSPVIVPWINRTPWYDPIKQPLVDGTGTVPLPFCPSYSVTYSNGVLINAGNNTIARVDDEKIAYVSSSVHNVIFNSNESK